MAKEVVVTHEGYKKLEDELNTDAFTLYSYPAARLTFGFTEGGNDDIAVGALAS